MDSSISIQEAERRLTEATETTHKKYGTFDGVFTPTLLTILGVIMYLRLGWVVGNAGLFWGLGSICQSLNAAFFKPNTLFLTVPEDRNLEHEYLVAIKETHEAGMSVLLFADDPKANLGLQQTINVWVPNQDPDWELTMKPAEINAALLLTVIISKAWNAKVNLIACTENLDHKPKAMDYLENVRTLARVECNIHVFDEPIEKVLGKAPQSDLDIMAMPQNFSFDYAKKIVEITQSASLFVWDSGHENAFS